MHRFKILTSLGDGSFGNVFKVQDKETGEILAMKKFKRKYQSWEDAVGNPEVKALI
jgi:serine/threonine protein kinase